MYAFTYILREPKKNGYDFVKNNHGYINRVKYLISIFEDNANVVLERYGINSSIII